MDVTARTKRRPTFRSVAYAPVVIFPRPLTWNVNSGPHGITAKTVSAGVTTSTGARKWIRCSAFAGTTSSLNRSFPGSAPHWTEPSQPTRFGPLRTWRNARDRRSMIVRTPDMIAMTLTITIAFTTGMRTLFRRLGEISIIDRPRRARCRAHGREPGECRSSIDLAEHDIDRADDRDEVRDEVANRHFRQRLQVDEARRPHVEAIWLVRPVRDEVEAELALRRLDRGVRLPHGRLDHARRLSADRSLGVLLQPVAALENDAPALPELGHPHEVAVICVGVLSDRDLEVQLRIALVGNRAPDVPLETGGPKRRARDPQFHAPLGVQDADVDRALLPDAVLRQELLVFVDALVEGLREGTDLLDPAQIVRAHV